MLIVPLDANDTRFAADRSPLYLTKSSPFVFLWNRPRVGYAFNPIQRPSPSLHDSGQCDVGFLVR